MLRPNIKGGIIRKAQFNWLQCLAFIVLVELVGNIGSFATFSQITTWYAGLIKPALNPSNWIFGPVWTILFALMGIALYLVWSVGANKKEVRFGLLLFSIQMVLNVLWSFIFFGFHQPLLAFIEIIILWIAILVTIMTFNKVSKLAAWLLLPYIAWVSFATYLTYAAWSLN